MKRIIASILALALLTACAKPNQNTYGSQDVGHSTTVVFGTVISSRPVEITGQNTGTGALTGMAAGAAAGSTMGQGNGALAMMLVGLLVGGIAGQAGEQALQDGHGIEYTIREENGKTVTIVQNIAADDKPITRGSRVMVQESGSYQRVLPDERPAKTKRSKKLAVEG